MREPVPNVARNIGSKLKLKPIAKSRERNYGPQNDSVPRLNRRGGDKT